MEKMYKFFTVLVIIVTLVVFNLGFVYAMNKAEIQQQLPQEALKIQEEMYKAFDTENYNKVISFADDMVTLYPDNKAVLLISYNAKIGAYVALKDKNNAERFLQSAYDLDPTCTLVMFYKGLLFYKDGKYADAIPYYTKCIDGESNGDSASAYNNRGYCFLKLQDYSSALNDFKMAIALKPDVFNYYYNEGYAYYMLKDYDAAVKSFSKALLYKPNDKLSYKYRAKCYRALGAEEQAIQDERRANALN